MAGNTDLRRRFDAKWELDEATGCWLWTAGTTSGGYGTIGVCEDGKWRMERAHRVAWMLHRGPIPAGAYVLHHCDTPPCVKPGCLFLGDQTANMLDMARKGRSADNRGVRNPHVKLTEAEAMAVLAERGRGRRQVDVAAEFGISQGQVSRIWLGERWVHLQEAV